MSQKGGERASVRASRVRASGRAQKNCGVGKCGKLSGSNDQTPKRPNTGMVASYGLPQHDRSVGERSLSITSLRVRVRVRARARAWVGAHQSSTMALHHWNLPVCGTEKRDGRERRGQGQSEWQQCARGLWIWMNHTTGQPQGLRR